MRWGDQGCDLHHHAGDLRLVLYQRVQQVGRTVQGDAAVGEILPEPADNLREVFVRSSAGRMLPLSSLVRLEPQVARIVERFNVFPAGRSSALPPRLQLGQALQALDDLAVRTLPKVHPFWIGTSYQESSPEGLAVRLHPGIVVVFLILAAQYERWSLPFAVVASVPFAMFGAIASVWARGCPTTCTFK